MVTFLFESKSTISARVCTGFVQIDVDLGMAEWTTASIAGHNSLVTFNDRRLSNELYAVIGIYVTCKVLKSRISIIVRSIDLRKSFCC